MARQLPEKSTRLPTVTIEPRSGWQSVGLRELWSYRDLLWIFSLRDIQVRYKQTVFGISWAVIQPLMLMVVMTLVFGKGLSLEDSHIPGVPYALSFMAAQIVWSFFASGTNSCANSLVTNATIVRKIYFPRLIMPIAGLCTAGVDFVVALCLFFVIKFFLYPTLSPSMVLLPLILVSMVVAALGLGLVMSALMVSYRDVRYVMPYLLQVGFFLTPIIWWEEQLGGLLGSWKHVIYLNPIAGPLTVFRDAMTAQPIDWFGWGLSSLVGLSLMVFGLFFFARAESKFADVA